MSVRVGTLQSLTFETFPNTPQLQEGSKCACECVPFSWKYTHFIPKGTVFSVNDISNVFTWDAVAEWDSEFIFSIQLCIVPMAMVHSGTSLCCTEQHSENCTAEILWHFTWRDMVMTYSTPRTIFLLCALSGPINAYASGCRKSCLFSSADNPLKRK